MIGGGDLGGADPFQMLNLVQQQQGGSGSFFQALSEDARQAVMRAREASAGTTPTDGRSATNSWAAGETLRKRKPPVSVDMPV